jgi:hypothetical protein
MYWKTLSFDLPAMVRMYTFQAVIILLAIPFPILFTLLMPIVTVSLVLVPVGMVMYAMTLYNIGAMAGASVADERKNESLDILRSTPRPLTRILLSKGAASIWRYMEDLTMPLMIALLCTLPVLVIQFDILLKNVDDTHILIPIMVIIGVATNTIRIFLEAIMIAAIGLCMGAANNSRTVAAVSTLFIGAFYFGLLNMARLLPLGMWGGLMMEIVVPLILPPLITLVFIRGAHFLITRD